MRQNIDPLIDTLSPDDLHAQQLSGVSVGNTFDHHFLTLEIRGFIRFDVVVHGNLEPWSLADSSDSPVAAIVRSKSLKMPVPRLPRYLNGPPVKASPAIRPVLLAVEPNG